MAAVIVSADYLLALTDCVVAGRVLGENALGAMNLLMPVFSAVMFFFWMFAAGTSRVYSRKLRRGDAARAETLAGQGVAVSLAVGAAVVAMLKLMEGPYLAFLAPSDAITVFSGRYWRWYLWAVVPQSVEMMLLYLLYAGGRERVCIFVYAVQIAANAAASYFLCIRFGMAGIAAGTVAAYAAGLSLLVWHVAAERMLPLKMRFDAAGLAYSVKSSFAESFVFLFQAVLFVAITKYVLYFWDSESLAVCAVVFCVIRLASFLGGVGVSMMTLEGTHGVAKSKDVQRVFKIGSATAFAAMALAAVVFFIAPEPVIGLFGIESRDLALGAKMAARITVVGLVLAGGAAFLPLLRRVKKTASPEAPLNYLQSYVLSRLADGAGSRAFNLAKLFRLRRGVDLEKLSAALAASGASHQALLTVLRREVDGLVVQRLELKPEDVTCPIVRADEKKLLADKTSLVKEFDIFGGRLFEAKIFDCGERAYLLSNFHHLICDGYSFPLILEDARRAWNGAALEPDGYYEVLARREERASRPVAVAGRSFVRELLLEREFTSLPADDFAGASGCGRMETSLALPPGFGDFLAAHRVTRHHVFLAAAVTALHRQTGADNLLVDWVFHGRVSKDELKTAGPFMVDLPMILEGVSDMTASDVIAHVKRSTFNGIKSVNLFRDITDCNPDGRPRMTFIYQDEWGELMSPGPVREDGPFAWMIDETIPLGAPGTAVENPFNVEIMEHSDSTRLFLEYDSGRYSEATVRRYADFYRESLDWLLRS